MERLRHVFSLIVCFFFFQAEDGIRDLTVTGVQTCALPISSILRDSTGTLLNPFHNYSAVRYAGISSLPPLNAAKLRAASTDYSPLITATYLQLPPLDPRIPELAKQITKNVRTPFDKAVAIESYLHNRFTYTLNLIGKPGDDPLAHFLFETHAGHCEYFASP